MSATNVSTEIVISREAIYDRDLLVTGYQLIYGSLDGPESTGGGLRPTDFDLVTKAYLFSGMGGGIERLVGQTTVFCPGERGVLTGEIAVTLPPHQTVIEVPADWAIHEDITVGCQNLVLAGYQIVLTDVQWRDRDHPLLPLVAMVKINTVEMAEMSMTQLDDIMTRCRAREIRTIAHGVSTAEQRSTCLDLGFDLFQGRAISRPRASPGRTLGAAGVSRVQLAASLVGDEFELDELEQILRTEVNLTFQLLQMASTGSRDGTRLAVSTIREALVLVGSRRIQSWLALLMLAEPGITSKQDIVVALTRARMSELLASTVSAWLAGLGFTAGMVSAFDLVLGVPASEIVDTIEMSEDLREAAFGEDTPIGKVIRDVIDHQDGINTPGRRSGIPTAEFYVAAIRALTWAVEATSEITLA